MRKTTKQPEITRIYTLADYEVSAKNVFDSLFLDAQELDPNVFCNGLSKLTYLLGRIRRSRKVLRARPMKRLRFKPSV